MQPNTMDNSESKCFAIFERVNVENVVVKEERIEETGESSTATYSEQLMTHSSLPLLNTDPGEKLHQCSICERKFERFHDMKRHYRTHTGEKPFDCHICGNSYSQLRNLRDHQQTHSGDKPFHCAICGKSFARKSILKSHHKTHTGEKPYQCDVCNKTFAVQSNMKSHYRIHTGEKPHKCPFCSKTFSDSSYMKEHCKTHTGEKPYQCFICDKTFARLGHMKNHHRTHTGEKLHQCATCSKSFARPADLRIHNRIHTGEKPYECTVCSRKFSQLGILKKHRCGSSRKKSQTPIVTSEGLATEADLPTDLSRTRSTETEHHCTVGNRSFTSPVQVREHDCSIHADDNSQETYTQRSVQTSGDNGTPFHSNIVQSHISEGTDTKMDLNEDVKPYICTKCSKCFTGADELNCHMLDHYSISLFGCGICERRFTCKDELVEHLKTCLS